MKNYVDEDKQNKNLHQKGERSRSKMGESLIYL